MLGEMTSQAESPASSQPSPSNKLSVLAICGSLRKKSLNRALLLAAAELLPDGMELSLCELHDIPLFNQDVLDAGYPEPVRVFRERIAAADALLIGSPEYNYSISGVLKNAIDWASRPPSPPLGDKPLGILGASPGMLGTVRGQMALRQVCIFTNMIPMNKPEFFLAQANNKFDGEGKLTDEEARKKLRDYLVALAAWTERLRKK
jgi:chromate reductase